MKSELKQNKPNQIFYNLKMMELIKLYIIINNQAQFNDTDRQTASVNFRRGSDGAFCPKSNSLTYS
jgi:hypothetical protein